MHYTPTPKGVTQPKGLTDEKAGRILAGLRGGVTLRCGRIGSKTIATSIQNTRARRCLLLLQIAKPQMNESAVNSV